MDIGGVSKKVEKDGGVQHLEKLCEQSGLPLATGCTSSYMLLKAGFRAVLSEARG